MRPEIRAALSGHDRRVRPEGDVEIVSRKGPDASAACAVVSISDRPRSAASTAFRVRALVARLVGEQIGTVVVEALVDVGLDQLDGT